MKRQGDKYISNNGKYEFVRYFDDRDIDNVRVRRILYRLGIDKFRDKEEEQFFDEVERAILKESGNITVDKENININDMYKRLRGVK